MKFKPFHLWAVLPVILIVAWFVLFYSPVSSKNRLKERELMRVKAEKVTAENEVNRLRALRKREMEAKSRIENMSADIPRYEDLPRFIKGITEMAKAKGALVEDFGSIFLPQEDQQSGPVMNPVMEITVKGRYLQMGRFLEELERNKAFKGVVKARMTYEEKQYPVLTGIFVVQFRAKRG